MHWVLYWASMTWVFLLANSFVGARLRRGGRPHGRVRLLVHGGLLLLIMTGYTITLLLLARLPRVPLGATIALTVTGAALVGSFALGWWSVLRPGPSRVVAWGHRRLSDVLLVSTLTARVLLRWNL